MLDVLSLADTLGVVVPMPLPDGRAELVGLIFLPFVEIPADEGLMLLLPAICNPPPPGCGLMPPP